LAQARPPTKARTATRPEGQRHEGTLGPPDGAAGELDAVERIIADWQAELPDLDVSPMRILARIARIEGMKAPYLRASFARHGLNAGLFDVLAALRRKGHPYRGTPTELAKSTMLTTGGITGRLDKLEEAGLIEREPSSRDRRITYVKLTHSGLEILDRVLDEHLRNERRLLAGLSAAQQKRLAADLADLEHSVRVETGGRMETAGS
jgi:DNA-binding MarR family transcriptional regulator